MECPKCGFEIDEKAMVCPNCKKVLKVICPVCKTVNRGNVCKKCGYVIVTKCSKCGKIAPTGTKKCKKCGTSLEKSVIINESNTDDFVMLTLDFPNMAEMKRLLGTTQLYNKFKVNLDKTISDFAKSVGIRRQIIGKTYVLRFNKDYSFSASANTAIKSTIQLLNLITAMNCKLSKRKNTLVKCNLFLLKRSINDNPSDCKTGFNVNLIQDKGKSQEDHVMTSFQLLTDQDVSKALEKDYTLSPLSSSNIDGKVITFFELDLKDYINIDPHIFDDDEEDEIKIPDFVQNMLIEQEKTDVNIDEIIEQDPDSIYDLKSFDFEEVNCDFIRTENADIFLHIINKFQSVPRGIVSIKADKMYVPYSLKMLGTLEDLGIFDNIITISCYEEMKYTPYAFFRDLVSAIFEFTASPKLYALNDFSAFANVDPAKMIEDLILLNKTDKFDSLDSRGEYFEIFLTLLQVIPNTLIMIENIEKIDSSSYDIIKFLFGVFDQLQISWLITCDKSFSLHKDMHFLLSKPYYTEIALKPSRFEKIISENKQYYKDVLNDFYFQRVAKYSCGSILFLDIAVQYLLESGVYEFRDDTLRLLEPKTIIIPSNLEKLFRRRLNLLKDDPETMRFLATVMLMGTRIDRPTIDSLGYGEVDRIIDKLSDMGYIYFYNNCMYFPNYNLVRENLLEVMNKVDLQKIANELFTKVFEENIPNPVKSYLYKLLEDDSNAFLEWEKLAEINLSFGDFSSYLNCTGEIIKLLDNKKDDESLDEYKNNLYMQIADNMYEYIPDKTQEIAEQTLRSIEKGDDIDRIIQLCSRMINGAVMSSKYMHALSLTHKVLSFFPNATIDPASPNFSEYYLLMTVIHVEILFNIGCYEDCLNVGMNVINTLNSENIKSCKPEYMDENVFIKMITDFIGYMILSYIIQLKGDVREFLNFVFQKFNFLPQSYQIFIALQWFIHGQQVNVSEQMIGEDRFSKLIFHIINAHINCKNSYDNFAEEMYKAKLAAKYANLPAVELLCDLLIANTYTNTGMFDKASSILYSAIRTLKDKGMTLLESVGWYFMSELNIRQSKLDVAYGILNNSTIQLERDGKVSDYIIMLFKHNMYRILMSKGYTEKAEICLNQINYICQKYSINFKIKNDLSAVQPEIGSAESVTNDTELDSFVNNSENTVDFDESLQDNSVESDDVSSSDDTQ